MDGEMKALIYQGSWVEAIKLYRLRNKVGLKEAKDAVDAWRAQMKAE